MKRGSREGLPVGSAWIHVVRESHPASGAASNSNAGVKHLPGDIGDDGRRLTQILVAAVAHATIRDALGHPHQGDEAGGHLSRVKSMSSSSSARSCAEISIEAELGCGHFATFSSRLYQIARPLRELLNQYPDDPTLTVAAGPVAIWLPESRRMTAIGTWKQMSQRASCGHSICESQGKKAVIDHRLPTDARRPEQPLASGCFDEVNQTIEGLLDIRLKPAPLNFVRLSPPIASLLSL